MSKITATAPGKIILLGEHSVVYGKPAVALAIDRRVRCTIYESSEIKVNGMKFDTTIAHPHIMSVMRNNNSPPLSVNVKTHVPTGSGLGSSAALSSSFSIAVRQLTGRSMDEESIANDAFEAEYFAQGRASPMDSSVCTHGYGVALNCPGGEPLWSVSKGGNTWDVSKVNVPEMTFVIGNTGIRSPTGPVVEKIRKYKSRNGFASDIINEMGSIALEGMKSLSSNDCESLGRLMSQNHKLLSILGASTKELNKLVEVASPLSYGAKLTGSGGGGCMIALTDRPEEVCEAISRRGGIPMIAHTGVPGARIEKIE